MLDLFPKDILYRLDLFLRLVLGSAADGVLAAPAKHL
jgi:hypothetical protein